MRVLATVAALLAAALMALTSCSGPSEPPGPVQVEVWLTEDISASQQLLVRDILRDHAEGRIEYMPGTSPCGEQRFTVHLCTEPTPPEDLPRFTTRTNAADALTAAIRDLPGVDRIDFPEEPGDG